ncbi:SAM-dependent methyltransferase [Pseudooceanicola sp. LIPI14-2-Ac024]|uniref:SAM-dependent methyltransferase n=1 Tax=Pseudooceanicola sp. LIPI14-2-Ac024 TaxID=3344875 RepID=UPI0035CFAAD3
MTSANSDERAFWNADPGETWVARQDILDELHGRVLDLVLDAAGLSPGDRVLDIGPGAGATMVAAARAVGPAGRVLGLDISEPMSARANAWLAQEGLSQAEVRVLDVQTDTAGETGFDVALSRFGVMFFDDPVAAFTRIRGLLRPGGRLAFAAWAPAEHNPWFGEALEAAVARLGRPPAGDPDAPGPLAFRDPARVTAILDAAGFTAVTATPTDTHLPVAAGLDAAVALARHIGPGARVMRLMQGTEADLEAILADIRTRFAAYDTPQGLQIPARVNLVTATAP